jgi:single-strand DNA-binding protein
MGEVGYAPSQKTMRNQSTVTMFSLGTSGMRNNRRPFEGEMPEQYRERSRVQWHRVAVYQYKLGASVMKFVKKGYVILLAPSLLLCNGPS